MAKVLGEFDHVRLPNPIEVNPTIGVQLGLTAECLIDYGGISVKYPEEYATINKIGGEKLLARKSCFV